MRRSALRLFALVGAAALALLLFRARPRDVVLVYDLRGVKQPTGLVVRIEKGGQLYREAEFPSPGAQVRHPVELTDGVYHLHYGIDRAAGGALHGEKDLRISESQTIVLSLSP